MNVGFQGSFLYIDMYSNPLKMNYETILQKIKNDSYFIEWMQDRFGEKADDRRRKMIETEVLSDEEKILVRECICRVR